MTEKPLYARVEGENRRTVFRLALEANRTVSYVLDKMIEFCVGSASFKLEPKEDKAKLAHERRVERYKKSAEG